MNLHDVFLRIRALAAPCRVDRELDEELAFHIERDTQRHLADGLSPADARARALARFGPVALAADHCRDARGTAFADALARDVLYAFRSFRRAPLAALTIVATVALGLGLVAAVFAVYSMIFLRADAVRSPGELFAVERQGPRGDGAFTRLEYEAIRDETSVFTDVVAMLRPVVTRIEGRRASAALVTGNFFQALGVQAAFGRALTPADDEQFAAPRAIVLSHNAWKRLFAGDPTAIGRSVDISARRYEIVGIMPEDFRGLGIAAPDYWASLTLAGQFRDAYAGGEDRIPVEIVGRLKPDVSSDAAEKALAAWVSARAPGGLLGKKGDTATGSSVTIGLRPRPGNIPADMLSLMAFSPMFFAFGLILMIGCANVANLLLARGVSRQRELGIRLSLGASRRRIVRQLLTENLLLALAAGTCGLAISRLLLAGGLHLATTTLPPELLEVDLARFVPTTDWRVALFMLAGAIASTAFFGLVPALAATRIDLLRTMRGEVTRDGRPARARHVLIAVQVGASALLLVCAATFLRGALGAATADPGVRTSDTARLSLANEPRRGALLRAVTDHPTVAALAAASPRMRAVASTSASATATEGRSPAETMETSSRVSVELLAVSPNYFDVLGIDVVSGRGFTQAERNPEAGVVVIHETVARQLWPSRAPLGEVLHLDVAPWDSSGVPWLSPRAFTVVGIARDPGAYNLVLDFRGIYLPTSSERTGTSLYLRVYGDPERTRHALLEHLTAVDPDLTITTMRAMAGVQTYVLRFVFWVTVVLGGLGLLLTASGLFSVLSYLVEQRAKEIGVRVALGATVGNVVEFVLSQSLRPVGIGLLAGGSLAVALAIVLMSTPAASEIGGTIRVFDPIAYVASTLVIVTGCLLATSVPALRAARLDPITTLRQD